jgi:RNA polymerase sigma factor (sigma-70 family)
MCSCNTIKTSVMAITMFQDGYCRHMPRAGVPIPMQTGNPPNERYMGLRAVEDGMGETNDERRGKLMSLLLPQTALSASEQVAPTDPPDAHNATDATVTALCEQYMPLIRTFIWRKLGVRRAREDVAEDLTQQTFIRLWRAMQHGVSFQTEAHARSFLHAIAANLLRDQWRSDQLRAEVPLPSSVAEESASWPSEPCAPDTGNDVRETLLDVTQVLLTMPESDRVLLLAHACGYRYEVMATYYALSIPGIKNRIYRTRTAFRQRYAESCGDSEHSAAHPINYATDHCSF